MTCDGNGRKREFFFWVCLSGLVHILRTGTDSYFLIRIIPAVESLKTPKSLGDCCADLGADDLADSGQKVGQVGVLI